VRIRDALALHACMRTEAVCVLLTPSARATEFFEACKLAAMQYLLGNLKFELMEGIYYFTPAAYLWMMLFIVPIELGRMREEDALGIVLENKGAFLMACTLGFFVNLLSFGVIKSTSSLTYKVSPLRWRGARGARCFRPSRLTPLPSRVCISQVLGQVKNVGVVLSSVVLFASIVTGTQVVGYSISIVGFFLYNNAKQAQMAAASSSSASRELEPKQSSTPKGSDSG
jgi:hypothetical protein